MGVPKDLIREYKGLGEWCILMGYRGSITHGTWRPNKEPNSIDDKDVISLCVPDLEYYFGIEPFYSNGKGTKEVKKDEWDIVIHEVRKAVRLLAKGNPNILSLLWLDEKHYLIRTQPGDFLLSNRDLFVGKHVYHSFVGYAHGQFRRMTHLAFEGYMGEKRKALVEKFGYDTKNAAHLIRILKMGIEFLNEGQLHVTREDAPMLLDIKDGKWELEKVKEEAERLFKRADEAYDRSTLPIEPDREAITKMCTKLIKMTLLQRNIKI